MDTSEQYVEMCGKAYKDLGILSDNGCPSQFITKDRMQWPDGALLLSGSDYESKKADYLVIGQVYRQDQLQEMVDTKANDALHRTCEFHDAICPNWKYFSRFKTLEQLWLAFVMHEKFGKSWNGTDWIIT